MSDEELTARVAVVTAGVVTNVIIVSVDPEDEPFEFEGSELVPIVQGISVDVGWLCDGEVFEAPPDPEE